MRSQVCLLETSLEAGKRQMSISHATFIAGEAKGDQNPALVDAQAQKIQVLRVIQPEVQRCLDDHSSFFRSSHGLFRYGINRNLHDYLRPLLDAACEHTVAFSMCPQVR